MSEAAAGGRAGQAVVEIVLDPDRFPRKVLFTCFGIELLLYVLDYHLNYGRLIDIGPFRRIFTATIETSLPSFFSVGQTLLVALTLWFIVRVEAARGSRRWVVAGWIVLAGFFSYMAVDDGAKLHERVGSMLGRLREEGGGTIDFPSYNWQYFLLPFFGGMGLFMLGFLWFQLQDRLSRFLVVIALGMLVVAVGIDFVEGLDGDHPWNVYTILGENPGVAAWADERFDRTGPKAVEHFAKSAEELFFEAGANSVLWFVFLRHLLWRSRDELRLRIGRRGPVEAGEEAAS